MQELFHQALSKSPSERSAFLEVACAGDAALKEAVEALLEADADEQGTLAPPISPLLDDLDRQLEGRVLGGYTLGKRLGVGGMGSVFSAERTDGTFERTVAVKIVRTAGTSAELLARFEQERRILASLEHPNIAALYDSGVTDDGRPYFVMELIAGQPIDRYCDEQRLSVADRLALFRQVCEAVHAAHTALVVHRDLKPSNVLVTHEGVVKLVDFGIAKNLGDDDASLTRTDLMPLTPAYAAPEQLAQQPVTTSADVFALGVMLYELLTGQRPFDVRRSLPELLALHQAGPPRRPSVVVTQDAALSEEVTDPAVISQARRTNPRTLRTELRGDLDTICLMALRHEPERRYRSAEQFAADIDRYLRQMPVAARGDSTGYRLRKFAVRNRLSLSAAAAAVFAGLGLTAYYTDQLAEQRDVALSEQRTTEQVVTFMASLFEAAKPENAQGREVTVREAVDLGAERLQSELTDEPAVRARLLNVIGDTYYQLGDNSEAESLYRESVELERTLYGEVSEQAAATELVLGFTRQNAGDLDEAEHFIERSLTHRRATLGDESIEVSDALNALAFLRETQGRYDEAEALFRENLALSRKLAPGDHESTAIAMARLAGLLRVADRAAEAEPLLRDALAMQRRIYEGEHPQTEETRRQLAGVLRDLRRFDESKALYESVIEVRTRLLGPQHREVAHTLNGLAELQVDLGDLAGAVETTKKIIEMFIANDPNGPSIGVAHNNLGFMQLDLGDFSAAYASFESALAAQDRSGLPADHPNRSYPTTGLGVASLKLGEVEQAHGIFEDMLNVRRTHFGAEHRLTRESEAHLGSALLALGRFDEAEPLLSTAYAAFLEARGPEDANTRNTRQHLVELYTQTGDSERLAQLDES